jgi:hypothetical protein
MNPNYYKNKEYSLRRRLQKSNDELKSHCEKSYDAENNQEQFIMQANTILDNMLETERNKLVPHIPEYAEKCKSGDYYNTTIYTIIQSLFPRIYRD